MNPKAWGVVIYNALQAFPEIVKGLGALASEIKEARQAKADAETRSIRDAQSDLTRRIMLVETDQERMKLLAIRNDIERRIHGLPPTK